MRVVRVLVPDDRLSSVRDRLDAEDVDHLVLAQGEDSDRSLVEFPIPTEGVDFALSELRDVGVEDEYVVVLGAESVESTHYDDLERRFVEEQAEGDAIATEEIRAKAVGMTPNARTYYAMTLLSALVATVGLLLDSPAIVVGSMVIAPQVGSAMTASVGAAIGNRDLLRSGLASQTLGLGLAIVVATAFGVGLKTAAFVPPSLNVDTVTQIASRISPGFLSVTVGLCAGAAGAFGLATAVPVSLVGVMIAAALIPAAAATGIGLAWGYPLVAVGAFVLLVANALAVNVAALATFASLGYRPDGGVRGFLRSDPVVAGAAVAMVLALAVLGAATAQHVAVENAVNDEVADVLDRDRYDDLGLVSVRVGFTPTTALADAHPVTVVVSRPADAPYPDFATDLERAIEAGVPGPVAVTVEYVEQVHPRERTDVRRRVQDAPERVSVRPHDDARSHHDARLLGARLTGPARDARGRWSPSTTPSLRSSRSSRS
jgi:uncharacterized hydrophobic protein (TIGR00341 family)